MNTLTLQKMRYLVTVAEVGSVTGAAKALFVSQPSLTKTIHEIEDEVGFLVFKRTGRGITTTQKGEELLAYIRQVLDQANLLSEKFLQKRSRKRQFSISSQHYSFAVRAFADLIKSHADAEYDFSFRETETQVIIDDVAEMRSALGVLSINEFNATVLQRLFKERDCVFTEIVEATPHVFLSREHPLAGREYVRMKDLQAFPYLFYDQGRQTSLYFSEELFSTAEHAHKVRVSDRATLFNLLVGIDGYTICSGVHDFELTNPKIVAIPLRQKGRMHIGYITHRNRRFGPLSTFFVDALKHYALRKPRENDPCRV